MNPQTPANPSRTLRSLGVASLASLALATPALGQDFWVQAGDQFSNDVSSSNWPQLAEWVGTNWKTYQTAWATAGPGIAGGYSISEYYVVTGSYAATKANSTFELDDLVFTSTGTTSEWVTLNLTLEGDYVVNNVGAKVEVFVSVQGTNKGIATAKQGEITATGALAGYDMTTPLSLQIPLLVQVNTPFKLKVGVSVHSTTVYVGNNANGEYRLRLGGGSTTDATGGGYEVFTLPAALTTVNSAQAGIVDNTWQKPTDLYLMASETSVPVGGEVELTSWNGVPANFVGMFLSSVDSAPLPVYFGGSLLDGSGMWTFGPLDHVPGLSGHSFGFTSFSFDALGGLVISDETTFSML